MTRSTGGGRSAYQMFFAGSTVLAGANILWKAWAPPKVQLFMYTALHRRTWTAERRKRHRLQEDNTCCLCEQAPESIEHLILQCPIAKEVWWRLLNEIHQPNRFQAVNDTLFGSWSRIRANLAKEQRKGIDSLFLLIAWHLRNARNGKVFRGQTMSVQEIIDRIQEEAGLWTRAGAKHLGSLLGRE